MLLLCERYVLMRRRTLLAQVWYEISRVYVAIKSKPHWKKSTVVICFMSVNADGQSLARSVMP